MLSVTGVYDGNKVVLIESVNQPKKCKVIVTFLEETDVEEEERKLRDFGMQTDSFDFWNNPAEDIYEDYAKTNQNK